MATRTNIYWLLTAFDGTTAHGSDSLMGSRGDARERAQRLADRTGVEVTAYRGGGTSPTFRVKPS